MTIQFYGGQVLFRSSSVAMDPACCCDTCDCEVPQPDISDHCTECAATDFPSSFSTPRDWKISISGVGSGTNTGCNPYENPVGQVYLGGACELTTVATNTSFFNADFTVGPCDTQEFFECIYLGCANSRIGLPDWYMFELNTLVLITSYLSGWNALVSLRSKVVAFNDSSCVGKTEATPPAFIYSQRSREFTFHRVAPSYTDWIYDPDFCTEECNSTGMTTGGCVPSGWQLTPNSPSDINPACKKALDVNSATCTVEAV